MLFSDWSELFSQPLTYLVDPSKRLFFMYLISSFVLACVVLVARTGSLNKTFGAIFNPRIWQHPSSRVDIQLFLTNIFIKGILFAGVVVGSVELSRIFLQLLQRQFGSVTVWALSYEKGVWIYALLSFVIIDFSRFFQHYLFHKVPWLWSLHRIHHSAEVLTPMTLYRTHPIESLFSAARRTTVVAGVSALFIFFTGSLIGGLEIFGVQALDAIFSLAGSNLRHSHVWLSFGPLNWVFISPAQHQLHHGRDPKYAGKNLGVTLALWDQLFGSFLNAPSKKPFLRFGVRGLNGKALTPLLWQKKRT